MHLLKDIEEPKQKWSVINISFVTELPLGSGRLKEGRPNYNPNMSFLLNQVLNYHSRLLSIRIAVQKKPFFIFAVFYNNRG
jgi:hypothetical protein